MHLEDLFNEIQNEGLTFGHEQLEEENQMEEIPEEQNVNTGLFLAQQSSTLITEQ